MQGDRERVEPEAPPVPAGVKHEDRRADVEQEGEGALQKPQTDARDRQARELLRLLGAPFVS